MEKKGIFFKLRAGAGAEYERHHANLPPAVGDALTRAGIRNYTIWREGDLLFAYYETESDAKAAEVLSADAAFQDWRKLMRNYVWETGSGQNEWFMKKVFELN